MEPQNNQPGSSDPPPPPVENSPYSPPVVQEQQLAVASEADRKQWLLFCHLSPLAGFIIPFGGIIASIVIWQTKKDEMPEIGEEAKEALNFQITYAIAFMVCIPLCFICIGYFIALGLFVADLILMIFGIISASNGKTHRYPMILRLV